MKNQHFYSRAGFAGLIIVMATVLGGCSSAPMPNEQIALSTDAVNRAVAAGATQYAPLEMKTAQDKVFEMQRAIGEKKYVEAKALAEQIEADASLAERKARTVKTQKDLEAAKQGIQVLKNEMLNAPNSGINPTSAQTH
ncbi:MULTISPECIES: DUF4398 domain-containing protein [unclassified Pseudomonas]|uniref:DUF4398 domain-containing protein n=1 Tax=unclassified Pseudomonas TaxID=196821 RepID=UPI000536F4D0|nr:MULTISPECIES: DUF4398 domain-containing protein [unclassified Pseudomonas]MBD0683036.1 DUF4398 domain-containing protein [Pseudomonas sp. PSB18]CDF92584.1 Chromosome segregation ATPases [Pseudomonas sp. SHC52]